MLSRSGRARPAATAKVGWDAVPTRRDGVPTYEEACILGT